MDKTLKHYQINVTFPDPIREGEMETLPVSLYARDPEEAIINFYRDDIPKNWVIVSIEEIPDERKEWWDHPGFWIIVAVVITGLILSIIES